jgi:hypothetical protein
MGLATTVGKGFKSRTTNPPLLRPAVTPNRPRYRHLRHRRRPSAADDIDAAIRAANNEPAYVKPAREEILVPLVIDEETAEAPQMPMPEMHAATRKMSFAEVELGFTREDAIKEACRCLRCDAAV